MIGDSDGEVNFKVTKFSLKIKIARNLKIQIIIVVKKNITHLSFIARHLSLSCMAQHSHTAFSSSFHNFPATKRQSSVQAYFIHQRCNLFPAFLSSYLHNSYVSNTRGWVVVLTTILDQDLSFFSHSLYPLLTRSYSTWSEHPPMTRSYARWS